MRVPVATYRLQFNRDFTFAEAEAILDYLQDLGISDCYASPVFRAGAQSTHGYDICCFGELNPRLGGLEGFRSFSAAARDRGLGVLLDMVPNHMGSALTNEWWVDVLKHGPDSKYAEYFDIDWNPPTPGLQNKVLLPVLEDHYWKVLGKLRVTEADGEFAIAYHDHKFPIAPKSEAPLKHLHKLLDEQHYRLAYWRTGPHEINYRRFFDITELVSLRMEREDVFDATHQLLFQLINEGLVTGIRVDHPDGLWNPKQYFERLQQHGPIYVVAEKILTGDEPLPCDWPVDGTTGYDFLNRLNGIFVDQENEQAMIEIYKEFTGCNEDFETVAYASKKKVLELSFQSELNSLAHRLKRIPQGRDFTLPELREALAEMAAAFPVYRTYATEAADPDPQYIPNPKPDDPAVDFVRNVLLLKIPERDFVMRFQQLTGPAMAKGLEDTAFYNYNRLLSLNEVGGSPEKFGTSLQEFHAYNVEKQKRWPHSLLATATHDTKRGEDLRARLNVLSEMPNEWRVAVTKWKQAGPGPTANDQYVLYQTLVGAWAPPDDSLPERICNFMTKAMREAKAETHWTDPNLEYENTVLAFAKHLLASDTWLREFQPFQSRVAFFGRYNSLSQTLLKLTCPGVPDFYQGTELWDFNLVDPDNRRPVDYKLRREMLAKVKAGGPQESKMFVIWKTLQFRNSLRDLFEKGDYIPIDASGEKSRHVCAFARTWKHRSIMVVVPRLIYSLCDGKEICPTGSVWGDARLNAEAGSFQNVFTGEIIGSNRLAEILKSFPIALLAKS